MSLAYGLMMLVTGLAIMTFGLFLFYAWLPLIYALIGFDIGLLLGRSLTGDAGMISVVFGISGAAITMAGAHHLLPGVGIFDRASGGALPALITLVLAVAGVFWQYSNLAKWIQVLPLERSASNTSAKS